MAIFNSYIKLPEGSWIDQDVVGISWILLRADQKERFVTPLGPEKRWMA